MKMGHLKNSFVLLVICYKFAQGFDPEDSTNIFINGFSIAGAFTSSSSAPAVAARMAVEDILSIENKRISAFRSVNISLAEAGDTWCNAKAAASLMYQIMSTGSPKPVILAGCPQDCELFGRASLVWNTLTICYGISKASLQGHLRSLFLAQPNPFSMNPSLIKFINHFGWKRVAVLYQDYENYIEIGHQLSLSLEQEEIDVFRVELFPGELPTIQLDLIKKQDTRVILTLTSEVSSREILCHIYHQRLFGADKYVWFFLGSSGKLEWFLKSNSGTSTNNSTTGSSGGFEENPPNNNIHSDNNIRQVDCTAKELIEAADGHFTTQAVVWNPNEQIQTVSGQKVNEFRKKLLRILEQSGEHKQMDFDEAPLAYDAVWAAYLVVNKTLADCRQEQLSSCNFAYDNYELGDKFKKTLSENLWFQGISGEVSFNQRGERSISNACVKIQRYKSNQGLNTVAWHFNSNNRFLMVENPFPQNIPQNGSASSDSLPAESPTPQCNSANCLLTTIDTLFIFILCSSVLLILTQSCK